jgi:hypothetical protein
MAGMAGMAAGRSDFVFRAGFTLVALSCLAATALQLAAFAQLAVPVGAWYLPLVYFAHPLPSVLRPHLPGLLNTLLLFALAALVLRRIALLLRARAFTMPPSYAGAPWKMMAAGLMALLVAIACLALSMAAGLRLAVLGSLLLLPASLLLSPVVAWSELMSLLRRGPKEPSQPPPAAAGPDAVVQAVNAALGQYRATALAHERCPVCGTQIAVRRIGSPAPDRKRVSTMCACGRCDGEHEIVRDH